MIVEANRTGTKVTFEFIAAVPRDYDTSKFDNGIGSLHFASLRLIIYPGGWGDLPEPPTGRTKREYMA
jgi:hypothetical protein